VAETEKQATFTGAQQRDGIYALPFAVDGLFGIGRPKASGSGEAVADKEAARIAREHIDGLDNEEHMFPEFSGQGTVKPTGKRAKVRGTPTARNESDGDEEVAAARLTPTFEFDLVAYRAAFWGNARARRRHRHVLRVRLALRHALSAGRVRRGAAPHA